jgi:soluble lytic murein transglycosylase-like protein
MMFGTSMLLAELIVASRQAPLPDTFPMGLPVPMASVAIDEVVAAVETAKPEQAADFLVEAIVQVESAGRTGMVGRHGERGLMQIKRTTWNQMTAREFGRKVDFQRAFEPDLNRRVGKAYLAWLHEYLQSHKSHWKTDERSLLLACYNAGPTQVKEAGFNLKHLPASTQDYVRRASALHESMLRNNGIQLAARVGAPLPVDG